MSEPRRLTDEELETLINDLQGTCNSLDTYIEEELDVGDYLCAEDYAAIDEAIFLCTECGWWCPQDENVAEDGEEGVCRDCREV